MEELRIEYLPIESLKPYDRNAKLHPAEQVAQIKRSIEDNGMNDPIGIWGKDNTIVEGHGRWLACKELGMETVPVIRLDHMTDAQRKEYALIHNQTTMNSGLDLDILNMELADLPDFDADFYGFDLDFDADDHEQKQAGNPLAKVFGAPPFSILDTRQGYWQERKQEWKNIGIKSEAGRSSNLSQSPDLPSYARYAGSVLKGVAPQTSIFDPVLCELMYKWFCTDGGKIFDCFAGGSVRGVVAELLGYKYTGIDLRQEQIDADIENASEIGVSPTYICDDSLNADKHVKDEDFDMLFSCPPYADLEVYSNDPRDISNMDYDQFVKTYMKIIEIACRKVKKDRFAVFVVGDVRDKKGFYRNFIDETKRAFMQNGFMTYNEFILVEQSSTAAMRAKRTFNSTRKPVKTHQNVLVFFKGDPKTIKANYGEIKEFGNLEDECDD